MTNSQPIKHTHIYVLLDRSGSMESIADDVVGGMNNFIREQRTNGDDARITVVQFDSQDPAEVIVSGIPIAEMTDIERARYQPRGGTPLLDATGRLIGKARADQVARQTAGLPAEDVVFVTVTDGAENQSCEYSLQQVKDLISLCEANGWTFVYLSAALDAYADAGSLGMHAGSTQSFSHSTDGVQKGMASMSRNMSNMREKKRQMIANDPALFFETGKDAEES